MPDTDPQDELPSEEAAAPAPSFVTADEFRASQTQTNQTLAALNETMSLLREGMVRFAQPPATAAGPRPAQITRGQFIEAVQMGNEQVIEAYEEQQKNALLAEHVHPLRDNGLEAIANLTRTTTVGALPYYDRYRKEIDGFIQNLPPGMRMSPEVYKTAHEVVVGRHMGELLTEAREAALRGTPEVETPVETGRGRSTRGASASQAPSPEDLGGRDVVDAMTGAGKTSDSMAQRMGYASWKDYMEKTAEYRG